MLTRRLGLSFAECGVLMALLDEQALRRELPAEPKEVAKLLGCSGISDSRLRGIRFLTILDEVFPIVKGRPTVRRNEELFFERIDSEVKALDRREKARKAAEIRWHSKKDGTG